MLSAKTQRLCVWSGPLLIVLFTLGFWGVAGLIPPPSPSATADQIRQFYIDGQTRIQIGLIITLFAAGLAFPWTVAIAVQMQRIEGRWSPMALTQLAAGLILSVLFMFPIMAWGAAAYRPSERPAAVTQLANDLGWLPFVGIGAPAIIQSIAIAIVVFRDPREKPILQRWVGYFNIWCALLFVPGGLVIAFRTGPFAWNGLFAFWIPLVLFSAWFIVMTVVLLRAITEQSADPSQWSNPTDSADLQVQDRLAQLEAALGELRSDRPRQSTSPVPTKS